MAIVYPVIVSACWLHQSLFCLMRVDSIMFVIQGFTENLSVIL